jgi:hypothetical protein
MSDLEKHIIEYRDRMNTAEPSSGHLKRFIKRLRQQDQRPVRKVNFRHVLQIAASMAIILTSAVVIVKTGKGGNKIAENQAVEMFQETTSFYARQVNERYDDIAAIPFDSEKEQEILLSELSEMDDYYKELLRELDANPGDERVMNALIQHYRIKLQVLDQIIEQLIQFKNSNTQENEKSTI